MRCPWILTYSGGTWHVYYTLINVLKKRINRKMD